MFSLAAAPEIDYFVGRDSSLASIESVLLPFTAAERKVVVLHGLGGIGKSQLAIEFAKKHRDDYSAILWLNAKTEDTLKQSFATNARRLPKEHLNQELLNGSQNEEALNAILREMKTWLGLRGNDKWLLIYDNVDNPKIPDNLSEHAYDIRSYFPDAHHGSILVTTRWGTLRIGHPIEVAKLSRDEESISLLVRMSRRAIGEGEFLNNDISKPTLTLRSDPGIKDLLRELDGLPLALATAGGYLGLTGVSVSEYLENYKTSWLELQRTSPALLSYEDRTMISTWNLSYTHIRKEDKSAAKLLELWACFDNRDLWYDLLKAGEDEAPDWFLNIISAKLAFYSAIGKLQKHALIEKLTESDGYSMHHCVHAWVRSVLCTAVKGQNVKLALTCVEGSFPLDPAPGDWITKQRLSLHFERCLQLLPQWVNKSKDSRKSEDCISTFFCSLGRLYHDQGKLTEAESMYQRGLAGHEKNSNHGYIFSTVNLLGVLYEDQGKLTEADTMYQRALAGYEKAFGRDHISTLQTVNNLGVLYHDQGNLTGAESRYQRALAGYEKALGRDHTSTLDTVNNLGLLYHDQGNLTEAKSMYQRALAGYERSLGRDHTSTLKTINNLGVLYGRQGNLTGAESMYQRALAGYEKSLGRDHTSTLKTINNLGVLYGRQGNLTGAESMYQRALAGYEKSLGRDHTSTLKTINNLGVLYGRQGNLTGAESMYQRALAGYEKALGRDHTSTLNTVSNLGSLYRDQGNLTGAESMSQRILLSYTRNPPPNPKGQLDLFYNMGLLSREAKNFDRAKDFFHQAHEGYEKLLGSQHAETIDALEELNAEIERDSRRTERSDGEGESMETD